MPHQIELSDTTFTRLQRLAVPLVDKTAEDVIRKLADFYEGEHASQAAPSPKQPASHLRRFSASAPPELTHTKILSAKLDGVPLPKPNWNGLLFELARRAWDRLNNGEEANRLIIVNFVHGKKEDEGYKFIPELELSVQGQDANNAWRGAYHIAKQLGIPLEVEFLWRNKESAAFPGETGHLSV
jgi:hypothetical protein